MFDRWTRDLHQALRALGRAPGFTVLAVATLGLAIGANAGIFSVVDTVLLDPLPYPDADRLVLVAGTAPGSDFPPEFGLAAEFLVHYQERSRLLDGVASYNSFTNTLRVGDRIERVRMSAPSTSLFATLGVTPIRGRLPVPEDESRVMVISHALWTSWFGSDEGVIGRSFYAGGEDRTVIGVMGPDFWFPNDRTLLWIPRTIDPATIEPGRFGEPLVARLAPGATMDEVEAELSGLARQLPERFGGSANYARLIDQLRPVVRPIEQELLGDVARPLWILLAATAIVLLIACANVANLFMVRAERRQSDLAVRRALGAGRGRLVAAQLAEAMVVALAAGVVAVVLATIGVPLLIAAAPSDVPRLSAVQLRPATLLFTFGASLLAALLCGLLPALRFSAPNLIGLREGGRGAVGGRRQWGRRVLVAAQTALALVLLIGSALLLRSFQRLRHVDPGYDTEDLFTFQIAPEQEGLEGPMAFARFHLDFMDRLAALPGVASVGIVENVPLDEGTAGTRFLTEDMAGEDDAGALLRYTYAAGNHFKTMGIDLLAGRPFERADHLDHPGNVVVSKSAAELLWPGREAIGRRLKISGRESWETVVGVVGDVRQDDFRRPPEPTVYLPLVSQNPEDDRPISSPGYVLRTKRATSIAPEIRALVHRLAPSAPMYRTYTMEFLAARSMVALSFTLLTLAIAAALALVLGIVGLYGVLSYAVATRTREIGVRMALGARASRVRRMVVAEGAWVLLAGVGGGAAAAAAATRSLHSLLYGIEPLDAATYLALSALMLLVGLAASYVPAWRASRVDPIEALRTE